MKSQHSVTFFFTCLLAVAVLGGCGGQPQPVTLNPTTPAVSTQLVTNPAVAASPQASATTVAQPSVVIASPLPTTQVATAPAVTAPIATTATSAQQAQAYTRSLQLQDPRMQGEDVRVVQQHLSNLGYAQVSAADGVFGPNTDAAVRAFQAVNGLTADGIVGPQTWERLSSSAAIKGSEVVPVVDGQTGYVLGGSHAGKWLDVNTTAAVLGGTESYRIYDLTKELGTTVGSKPEANDGNDPCPDIRRIELQPAPNSPNSILVSGSWNALPRVPREEATTSPVYVQAVTDLLKANGIAQPDVQLTKVIRIDLEGDGTEEVLIAADRHAGVNPPAPSIAVGDYSLVALRKLVNGKVETIILASEYHTKAEEFAAPYTFTLVATPDLNGDGTLEIVMKSAYYEGSGITVFSVTGTEAKPVLEAFCGV